MSSHESTRVVQHSDSLVTRLKSQFRTPASTMEAICNVERPLLACPPVVHRHHTPQIQSRSTLLIGFCIFAFTLFHVRHVRMLPSLIRRRQLLVRAAAAATTTVCLSSSFSLSCSTSGMVCDNMGLPFSDAMPQIGLGTLDIPPEHVAQVLPTAIRAGYRRIDCAPVYFNEDSIGDALYGEFNNDMDRNEVFVVSKLASPFHQAQHVELAVRKTLLDLRLAYLDLYLIHWPVAFQYVAMDPNKRGYENEDIDDSGDGRHIDPTVSIHETWRAMEELVDKKLVRYIGVSNFPVSLLHELLTKARIAPCVNQVELHPYLQQIKLVSYCHARGIAVQAYSPLGTPGYKDSDEPRVLDDPVLNRIASKHNISPAQVCLTWALQRNTSVVVKSVSEQHQQENVGVAPLAAASILTEEDMANITKLDRGYRFFRPEDWWGEMAMAVFE